MRIVLSAHLKIRLSQRQIHQDYPAKIIENPDSKYFDTGTGHKIAIKKLKYGDRKRSMIVAYDIINARIQVITIHPISEQEINNKLKRKRWVKDEKN